MYPQGTPILVIDGEANRRRLTERLLAAEGFAVIAVSEGFSAIRTAGLYRFALAVAAVQLPGTLDAVATLRLMRARQPWLKALFIGDAAFRSAQLDRYRDEFIASPFRARELLGCAFELLQREPPSGERGRASRSRAG
jgi:DNA-binding response OmpR family regulator